MEARDSTTLGDDDLHGLAPSPAALLGTADVLGAPATSPPE
jgi:hypothetical protein